MSVFFLVFGLICTFGVAIGLSSLCITFGIKYGFINKEKMPRIGGIAILASWWLAAVIFGFVGREVVVPLIIISLIILSVGLFDARRPLGPWLQFFTQIIIAALAVYWANIDIKYITNPFGGIIDFRSLQFFGFLIPGGIISMLWIIFMMNVINFLDGMDGLAGCVTCVAFIAIGFVSLLPQVNDPATAVAAFSAAVAIIGFLFWNFPPASLILGTVGSWFLGFLVAILAINGATKVATTAVVGAVPLIDALIVVIGRLGRGHSPFRGDLTHLHHRLKRRGLSDRFILTLYTGCSILLGLAAVLFQTHSKIIIFMIFSLALIFFVVFGSYRMKHLKSD